MAYDGPRFRRDLISTVFYEGGIRCVDVHDPKRGATFRLFDYEYSVALAFDGRDLSKVISWVRVSTGLELNEEQLTSFAARLDQLGFLERPETRAEVTPPPVAPSAPPAPLPVPHVPTPAPHRDETAPPPEAGSLATATRPLSDERLVGMETPPEPMATEAPESEPERGLSDEPPRSTEPAPAEAAGPEEIATSPEEVATSPEVIAAGPEEIAAGGPEEVAAGSPEEVAASSPEEVAASSPEEVASSPEDVAAGSPEDVAAGSPEEVAASRPEEVAAGSPEDVAGSPEKATAPPDEMPESPAVEAPPAESQEAQRHEALVESGPADQQPAAAPTEAPGEAAPAAEPAPQEQPAGRDATTTEAAPTPNASSSEPELPLAVGPSPERPRVRPAQRSARLPTEARAASPAPRREATPPPIPRSHLTPTPAPVTRVGRGAWMLSALFGILAALVVGAVLAPFALGKRPPAPVSVQVIIAQPTEVVRWLPATAPVEPPPLQTLTFPAGGKVLRIASPGLELRPGDVVAATEAARAALDGWARAQEQLAFARQLVEGLRESADEKKMASAQAAVAQKTALEERARDALSRLAIIAKEPGTVDQTLVNLGQTVRPGDTAVRVRLPGWRARFEQNRLPAAQLRKQGLCLAEISGRQVPCNFVSEESDDTHLLVSFPADAVSSPGLLLHLAHSRIPSAYVLPTAAVSDSNGKPRVLVAAPHGRVEMRSVVLADRTPHDAVVTQGLDPGDAVIVTSDQPVGAGTRVRVED